LIKPPDAMNRTAEIAMFRARIAMGWPSKVAPHAQSAAQCGRRKGKSMGRIWIALALSLAAAPAMAQSNVQKCVSEDSAVAIVGCTALIQEGGLDTAHMAGVSVIRGNAYSDTGAYDNAIADYTKAISLKPDAVAYGGRGLVYAKQGKKDLAVADFRAALKIDPSDQASIDGLKRLGLDP
jgi:tetratricopeptide (TPR) repeat protein